MIPPRNMRFTTANRRVTAPWRIEALEHVLADHAGSAMIAAIVAQAHMDIGGPGAARAGNDVPARNHAPRRAFERPTNPRAIRQGHSRLAPARGDALCPAWGNRR